MHQPDADQGQTGGWLFLAAAGLLVLAAGVTAAIVFWPPPYSGVTLQRGVVYVSSRRHDAHGLERIEESATGIALTPWTAATASATLRPPVTILVHGYNAQEHKIATYFAGLIQHLQEAGAGGSLVVFDWPARGVPFDELPISQRMQLEMMARDRPAQIGYESAMYKADQSTARSTGVLSFLGFLRTLPPVGSVRVIGHSMGCYLLAHALHEKPDAFARVSRMIWLAPDVDAALVNDGWFAAAVTRLQRGLAVYYARDDSILTGLSRISNLAKRLGGSGPELSAGDVPSVEFVDMTGKLPGNVHAAYLERESASARRIAQDLAAQE